MAKLTRQQASAPLSKAERLAGQELRNTDRQLAQFRKSVLRAKMMSTEFKRQHEKSIDQVFSKNILKFFKKFLGEKFGNSKSYETAVRVQ